MSQQKSVSAERVIAAPPEAIFALVADPAGHVRIDGSGTVQASKVGSRRLQLGDTFTMDMKIGVPYRSANVVIELEENRRIAWRQKLGGQVWRYELEPADGGTLVRETFDWSKYRLGFLVGPMKVDERNRKGIEKTLARIADLVADTSETPA